MEVTPQRENAFKHMTWIDVNQSLLPNFRPVNMILDNNRDWAWLLGAMYIDPELAVPGRDDLKLGSLYDSVLRTKEDRAYRINVVYSGEDILGRQNEYYASFTLRKSNLETKSIKVEWMNDKIETYGNMIMRKIAEWIDRKSDQIEETLKS